MTSPFTLLMDPDEISLQSIETYKAAHEVGLHTAANAIRKLQRENAIDVLAEYAERAKDLDDMRNVVIDTLFLMKRML